MNMEERIELLLEAQENINVAIKFIQDAVKGTKNESPADAYIIGHLDDWANGGNPYDSTNIPNLIEDIKKEKIN